MAAGATLKWRGEEVTDAVILASARAIESVLDDCVEEAKATAPVRSGKLRSGIRRRAAKARRGGVSGRWGAFRVPYALIVERRKPFLQPVADRIYPRLPERIREEYEKGATDG